MHMRVALLGWLVLVSSATAAEPWTTARGTLQRTGCTDNVAGPLQPRILWVYSSEEHFIASPVPHEGQLLVSSLGGFNVSVLRSLAIDPKAANRVTWSKTTPVFKLP